MKPEHKDLPVPEALAKIEKLIGQGALCWVKFTCDHCGSRQTSDTPNTWATAGYTCEECGKLTIPERIGFMLAFSNQASKELLTELSNKLE